MSKKLSERLAQLAKVQQTIEQNIELLLKSTRLPFYPPDYSRLGHSYVVLGRAAAFDNKEREPFASNTYSTLLVLFWSSEWASDGPNTAKRTILRQLFQTVHSTLHMTFTSYTQQIASKIPTIRYEGVAKLLGRIPDCICLLFQLSSIIACSTEFTHLSPQWNAWVEDPSSPMASLCGLIHDMLNILTDFMSNVLRIKSHRTFNLSARIIHSSVAKFLVYVNEYIAVAMRNTWSVTASSTLSSANSFAYDEQGDARINAQFDEDQEQSPPEANPEHRNIAVDINRAQKLFVETFMSPFTNFLSSTSSQSSYSTFKVEKPLSTKTKRSVAATPSKLRPTTVRTAAPPQPLSSSSSSSSSSLSVTPHPNESSFDESADSYQYAEDATDERQNTASPVPYQQYSHPPIPTLRQNPPTPYVNEHDQEYYSPVTFPAISPQTPTTTRYLQGPQTPTNESFTEGFFYSDFGATPVPAPDTPLSSFSDNSNIFDL